jgi:two-component system, OmpR family, sensor histidine kinase CpxA
MKIRFPLCAQIITVFFVNIFLLLAICLLFFSSQFDFGWQTLIYSPIGMRIQSIAFVVDRQIRALPTREWNHVLAEFGESYGVKFYLFDPTGDQIAGDPITLPVQVKQKITEIPPHMKHIHHEFKTPGAVVPGPDSLSSSTRPQTAALNSPPDSPFVDVEHGMPSPPPFSTFLPFPSPPGRLFLNTHSPDMTWIGAFTFPSEDFTEPGTLLAATPNLWQTRLIYDFSPVLLLLSGVLLVSLFVWWPFIYGITTALHRLTSTTERIAQGNFETSLRMHRFDEIGQLAQSISIMSAKLKVFVFGQRRFLGDVAHELCAPMSRLQMAVEILVLSCNDQQMVALNYIREEVEQMSSLINELLAFSKAGIMGKELQLVSVDLELLLLKVSSLAPFKSPPILEIHPPISCQGDELLLERAFGNILRNASRYASDSGPVLIQAKRIDNEVVIIFADNGPGVKPEALEFLGQPFYRPESSRNRSSGGVGLGLSIVKTCVEACGGRIALRNRDPKGLEVEMRLVANKDSEP